MSNFKRPNSFEFDLGGFGPRVVIVAELGEGYLHFRAFERGVVMGRDVPDGLQGAGYSKMLVAGPAFHAHRLRDAPAKSRKHVQASLICALADGEIIGKAAEDAVWRLFWELVLADKKSDFVKATGHRWLSELRAEVLAGTASRQPAAV
jgi:hypothetical protein